MMSKRSLYAAVGVGCILCSARLVAQSQRDIVALRGRDTVFIERFSRDSSSVRSDLQRFGFQATHQWYVARIIRGRIDTVNLSMLLSSRSDRFTTSATFDEHGIIETEEHDGSITRVAKNFGSRAFPIARPSMAMIEQLIRMLHPVSGPAVSILTYQIGNGDTATADIRRLGDSVMIEGMNIGYLRLAIGPDLSIVGGTQSVPGPASSPGDLTFFRRPATPIPVSSSAPLWTARDPWKYRGFTVDMALLPPTKNREAVLAWLRKHIDIVSEVKVDSATRQFFRTIPLIIDSADASLRGGRYSRSSGQIAIGGFAAAIDDPSVRVQPMLLHELLHAYHDQRLPGSIQNPDVFRLFHAAHDEHAFADTSYMMTNAEECFAMAGSVYLHGTAARDPLTRENLKSKQPALYDWLEMLFGPR